MPIRPFSELNEHFYRIASDPLLFEDGRNNFLKLVQQGLSYADSGFTKKLIRNRFIRGYYADRVWHLLASKVKKGWSLHPEPLREVVLHEFGRERYDADGKPVSMYFERLKQALGRDSFSILQKTGTDKLTDFTLSLSKEKASFNTGVLKLNPRMMLRSMHRVFSRLKASGKFTSTELHYIASVFHLFFEDYKFYNGLLEGKQVKVIALVCHYHQEGLIAAARGLGIKVIELQHGLIAENDLYYCYPAQFKGYCKKAFFPDRLLVYGTYWRNVVLRGSEYDPEQVVVAGDYTFSLQAAPNAYADLDAKPKNIFIGAQKNMPEFYVPYLKALSERLIKEAPDWQIIIKLHPSENKPKEYEVLRGLKNIQIRNATSDLFGLMQESRIQISIYSTTFYDAAGFGVMNMSLQDYGPAADYAKLMVKEKVALPLAIDENPVHRYEQERNGYAFLKRDYFYDSFDAARAVKLLSFSTT